MVDAATGPRAEYERRIDRWSAAIAAGERAQLLISNLRLFDFALLAVLAWLAFVSNRLSPAWLIAPAVAFLALLALHARVILRNERAVRARRMYERGLDRIDGRWAGSGPDGTRFLEGHPYARDLDLFGPASLFQLIDIARTEAGEETLAAWLAGPSPIEEVGARQAAVRELAPRVDFREDVGVLAAEAHVGRTAAISGWAAARPAGLTARAGVVLAASAVTTAVLVGAAFAGWLGSAPALVWVLVQVGLAAVWRRKVALVLHRIDLPAYDLALLVGLLERVEREPFESPRLAELHARLMTGGIPPSRRIARLQTAISALDSTHNLLFRPIAALLLVRSLAAVAIDRWHAAYGPALVDWLRDIGELEALLSLAAFAYEHPADPFPELVEEGPLFDAERLAHPLIAEAVAVRNDLRLGTGAAQVLVVSGSNMSGKSTLLRAVGVNVVLALAGGPVRASALTLSPLSLGATLKVEDSLAAGHSRFYAEILRIRRIVDVARGPRPLLFLLDEILHGTNSHDRRVGAEAVVRALVAAGAIGLVTTHDLALTELVGALDGRAANVHFEDRIEEGKIVFDYRMRPGVVARSNALALMRAVGLDV